MVDIDLTPVLNRIGAKIKAEAIRMCPTDMGDLRRSIDYRIVGNSVILFASDPKATDMEFGTPPEPLSDAEKDEIKAWADRHQAEPGAIIAYLEKMGIKVGTGQDPLHITSYGRDSYRPFLRPAVFQNLPEILEIIKEGFA